MAVAIDKKSIQHPNTFSLAQGKTILASDIDSINQAIRLILSTSRGELFGDPMFGSRLKEMLFDYIGTPLRDEIKHIIADELTEQEPRINVTADDIEVSGVTEGSNTTVTINIVYTLRYTDISSEFAYVTQVQEGE